MSQESRLQHLGIWHLRNDPKALREALEQQTKEDLAEEGLVELPDDLEPKKV